MPAILDLRKFLTPLIQSVVLGPLKKWISTESDFFTEIFSFRLVYLSFSNWTSRFSDSWQMKRDKKWLRDSVGILRRKCLRKHGKWIWEIISRNVFVWFEDYFPYPTFGISFSPGELWLTMRCTLDGNSLVLECLIGYIAGHGMGAWSIWNSSSQRGLWRFWRIFEHGFR